MPTDLQTQIGNTPDGGTCRVEAGEYTLHNTTAITVTKNMTIDFGQAVIKVPNTTSFTTGGFQIKLPSPTSDPLNRVVIKNGRFEGVGSAGANASNGPVIYTDPAIKLDLLQVESCVFRNISYGCNIDCTGTNAYIRSAIVCKNLFDGIFKNTGVTTSIASRFALNGSNGLSYGNTFRTLKEYGIKVDNGGPFLSLGDSFFDHANSSLETGAVLLSGGPHLMVSNGYFQVCQRGINLLPSLNSSESDVSISDCTFVDTPEGTTDATRGFDIILNRDLGGAIPNYGRFENVTVSGTKHSVSSASSNGSRAIRVWSFKNMTIRNVVIERKTTNDSTLGASFELKGASDTASGKSDRLVIDGVRMRFLVTNPRGFDVDATLRTPPSGQEPEVVLKNIDFKDETTSQVSSLYPVGAGSAPTPYPGNPKFKIPNGKYWEL